MQQQSARRSNEMADDPRKTFFMRLHALALACRFDFDAEGNLPAMYERSLSSLGYEKVNAALLQIFEQRRSNDPFPSVREIKGVMNASLSPEDEAPLIAGRIMQAIVSIGLPINAAQTQTFRESVGEVGWRVIQMSGGLETVCSIQDRDIASNRAQWTKLAQSLLRSPLRTVPESHRIAGPKQEVELKSLAHILGPGHG